MPIEFTRQPPDMKCWGSGRRQHADGSEDARMLVDAGGGPPVLSGRTYGCHQVVQTTIAAVSDLFEPMQRRGLDMVSPCQTKQILLRCRKRDALEIVRYQGGRLVVIEVHARGSVYRIVGVVRDIGRGVRVVGGLMLMGGVEHPHVPRPNPGADHGRRQAKE